MRFSAFAYSEIGVALIGSRDQSATTLRMWGPGSPGIVDVPYDGPVVDVTLTDGEIVPHYSLPRTVASPDGAFTARWRGGEGLSLTDAAGTDSLLPMDPVSVDNTTTMRSIAFSPDSRWLAAIIIPDQRATFWDVTTGEQVQTFRTQRIFDVAVSDTYAAISTPDGFRVWPMADWDSATRLDTPEPFGEQANVRVLLGSTQVIGWDTPYPLQTAGECIGCGADTYGFILYAADVAGGAVRTLLETDAYTALDVALSPDETFVAVGGDDGLVHLIDLATGDEIAAFGSGQGAVNAVLFDATGRLAAGYESGIVQVWAAP
jgi:WD40 repeat protein